MTRLMQFMLIAMMLALMFSVIWAIYTTFRVQDEQDARKAKSGDLPTDAGIRDLIVQGRMDDAEELYRRFTGVDPFTARAAIDDMEREMRLSGIESEVVERLNQDDRAGAIQAYQAMTGADLAEALDYVETLQKQR